MHWSGYETDTTVQRVKMDVTVKLSLPTQKMPVALAKQVYTSNVTMHRFFHRLSQPRMSLDIATFGTILTMLEPYFIFCDLDTFFFFSQHQVSPKQRQVSYKG